MDSAQDMDPVRNGNTISALLALSEQVHPALAISGLLFRWPFAKSRAVPSPVHSSDLRLDMRTSSPDIRSVSRSVIGFQLRFPRERRTVEY